MKIYTLFYKNTGLYNHSLFVCPNDETAKEAMKLNLMDKNAERFKNQVIGGDVELRALCTFDEERGVSEPEMSTVCNLKDILNDIKRNMESIESNKS